MQRIKYPRTLHLPWSPGSSSDDKVLGDVTHFHGRRVIVTEKMDGESAAIYSDGFTHARSLDSRGGVDRDWLKTFAQSICFNLPTGWRVCGENLWAKHSIHYEALPSYFLGFSLWNEKNECLSWDETLEYFSLLEVLPVSVIYDGIFSEQALRDIEKKLNLDKNEGYVVRTADGFNYEDFDMHIAKWVRAEHVQTDEHWRLQPFVRNGVKDR